MKVGVKVMPRDVVLDTQGRAVEKILNQSGHAVETCRVGRFIEIDLPVKDRQEAEQKIKTMAEYVLYNPLIEKYELVFHD